MIGETILRRNLQGNVTEEDIQLAPRFQLVDIETKKVILKRIRQCLQPQGCLFLGTAETTLNIDPEWQLATLGGATIYHNRPALAVAA